MNKIDAKVLPILYPLNNHHYMNIARPPSSFRYKQSLAAAEKVVGNKSLKIV